MATVCASDYGGPNDPTSGTHGYHGDLLTGRMAFAELNMGTALGGLPYRAKLRITYGGRSVVAEKLDIGLGGAGCGGHPRSIDLWWETARALGFSGLAPVSVATAGGAAVTPVAQLTPFEPPGGHTPFNIPGEIIEKGTQAAGGLSAIPQLISLLKLLSSREGWIRIGKVLLGLFLLLTGVLGMANIEATKTVTRTAGKTAEVAALIPK